MTGTALLRLSVDESLKGIQSYRQREDVRERDGALVRDPQYLMDFCVVEISLGNCHQFSMRYNRLLLEDSRDSQTPSHLGVLRILHELTDITRLVRAGDLPYQGARV